MLDTFDSDQFVGDPFDTAGQPLDNHHFKTVMMVEMNMQRRNDLFVVRVLMLGQFVR